MVNFFTKKKKTKIKIPLALGIKKLGNSTEKGKGRIKK